MWNILWITGAYLVKLFLVYHHSESARSKFWGVSGSEDRGGGDNSIQFINIGRLKNGDEK